MRAPSTVSLRSRFPPSSSDVGSRVVFFLHPSEAKINKSVPHESKTEHLHRENVSFSPIFHVSGPSASEFLIFLLFLALRSFSGSAPTHARTIRERESGERESECGGERERETADQWRKLTDYHAPP